MYREQESKKKKKNTETKGLVEPDVIIFIQFHSKSRNKNFFLFIIFV